MTFSGSQKAHIEQLTLSLDGAAKTMLLHGSSLSPGYQGMKIVHRFFSNGNAAFKALVDQLEIPHKYTEDIVGKVVTFDISEDDDKWPVLSSHLDSFDGVHTVGTVFNKKEIKSSDWLFASVGEFQYPQSEEGYIEQTYDLSSACPKCLVGKKQKAPFRLKSDFKQKRAFFYGLHWVFDVVLTRPFVIRMMQEKFPCKIGTLPVIEHKTGKVFDDLVQIVIPILDKAFVCETEMEFERCSECGTNKRIRKERGMVACCNPGDQIDLPLFLTQEWFGSGGSSRRQIVVSNDFMTFVDENKLRGFSFEPINTNVMNPKI